MLDEEVPREVWVPALAKRIITQHHGQGGCARCWGDRCQSLAWARDRLKAARMAGNRPDRYAPPTPGQS